jgi:hypothetical protein
MAYLGMVPSEHTSGSKRRIGAITKAGDIHPSSGYSNGFAAGTLASLARTLLIEAAHSYRFPARIAHRKLAAVDAVPEAVRAIAWKAQTRLCQRYRQMMAKGKPNQVVVTAIARELAGFVWAIACITSDPAATDGVADRLYSEATMESIKVNTDAREVTMARDGAVKQGQQSTAETGRSHASGRQPRAEVPSRTGRSGQTKVAAAEASLTG